jgi:hypothetical protein
MTIIHIDLTTQENTKLEQFKVARNLKSKRKALKLLIKEKKIKVVEDYA